MNPVYQTVGGGGGFQQALSALKANPAVFFAQRGMNLPAGIGNNPNAIIQHLLSTGRISQAQVNQAWQMAQRFR